LWSVAKGGKFDKGNIKNNVQEAILRINQIFGVIDSNSFSKALDIKQIWSAFNGYLRGIGLNDAIKKLIATINKTIVAADEKKCSKSYGADEPELKTNLQQLRDGLSNLTIAEPEITQQSANKPIYFSLDYLQNSTALYKAASIEEGDQSFRQFLRGLQLRIGNRLQDQRWYCFFNYDNLGIKSFRDWLEKLGIGSKTEGNDVCVIDCSMIDYEILPYVCGIIGRLLLELREHVPSKKRFHEPWVAVLEEAHNYVCPLRQNESRGLSVSREAFERIAKEGRKFGLSLIVASQRPGAQWC